LVTVVLPTDAFASAGLTGGTIAEVAAITATAKVTAAVTIAAEVATASVRTRAERTAPDMVAEASAAEAATTEVSPAKPATEPAAAPRLHCRTCGDGEGRA
jgi:hypothetical protein